MRVSSDPYKQLTATGIYQQYVMVQQIPSQQTEQHPGRCMEEKGVVCVERSSYSGTQNLHQGESPESTLGHYFLLCEMRELRVIHIKGLAHDLSESGAEMGPGSCQSLYVCHCHAMCIVKRICISHIHKDNRFSGTSCHV